MRRNVAFLFILLGAAAASTPTVPALAQEPVKLGHVHGLGFSSDGSRLKIPDHYGIAIYSDGRWSKAPGPAHDYMGFVVTREFIISSGHPERSGNVANPVGLIRSSDRAQSWTNIGFAGEAEFHIVAAGHASKAVYVYSTAPNSHMPRPGIYQAMGENPVWRRARGHGLRGELTMLSAHPTEPATIAAATDAGLFLSRDGGDRFKQVAGGQVTAVYLTLEGDGVWFGVFDGKPRLFTADLTAFRQQELALPAIGHDAIAYIAQNPVRRPKFAIVNFQRSVFITPDRGHTWTQIAQARGTSPGP